MLTAIVIAAVVLPAVECLAALAWSIAIFEHLHTAKALEREHRLAVLDMQRRIEYCRCYGTTSAGPEAIDMP